jgi:NADH-quinone oxidoreductase subunit J
MRADSAAALKLGNTKLLGIDVYTNYLYPLQIAAVICWSRSSPRSR